MSLDVFESAHPAFFEDAACNNLDPNLFYPDDLKLQRAQVAYCKSICALCTVRDQCLNYAIEQGEEFGIWGGKTPYERERIAKRLANPRLTRCVGGHLQTPENQYRRRGVLSCRLCARERRASRVKYHKRQSESDAA